MPSAQNSPKIIKEKHTKEDCNNCLTGHWRNGHEYAEGWNFGPKNDDAMAVNWILDQMVSKWNTKASWQLDSETHPHEAGFLKLDISKAKLRLNWQPTWQLECALTKITQWHQAWLNKEDMQQICLREINEYSRDMKHESY